VLQVRHRIAHALLFTRSEATVLVRDHRDIRGADPA